jgi:hypothetical protein
MSEYDVPGRRGRRSGEPGTAPVMAVPDGVRFILIASNWGQQRHPGWYYNLRAVAAYPGYAAYARRTGREIRVFVLDPGTGSPDVGFDGAVERA